MSIEPVSIEPINGESFDQVVEKRQKANGVIAKQKTIVDACNMVIKQVFALNKLKSVVWRDNYEVILVEPAEPKGTIDAAKLIELGVEPSIIAQATVYGEKGEPHIRVQKIGKRGVTVS